MNISRLAAALALSMSSGALLLIASTALGQCPLSFAPPVSYPTATGAGADNTWALAVGDFNGDGRLDVITALLGAGSSASLLLNSGNGMFQPPLNFPAGTAPDSVTVGDFNHDGNLDCVIVDGNLHYVRTFSGDGHGGFASPLTYAVNEYPDCVVAGDLNNDGRTDLAVSNQGGVSVSVLLGNAAGTLQNGGEYPTGEDAHSVAIGDFRGDGWPDLIAITAYRRDPVYHVKFLHNNHGSFGPAVIYDAGADPGSVAVGDFNRDGKLDLAVTVSSGVSISMGNGDGTFAAPSIYPAGNRPGWISVEDFNRDGFLDIAVTNFNSGNNSFSITILSGNASGTFPTMVTYPVIPSIRHMTTGDLNGDGWPDIALATTAGVTVLLNTSQGPPPLFTQQPVDLIVHRGAPATFTGFANGVGITYQWRRNGTPLNSGGNIFGATSPLLTINPVTDNDVASYDVQATSHSLCGGSTQVTTSDPAELTICYADFDNDDVVDFFDYLAFVSAFAGNQPSADFNHDGVIDFFDYLDFVEAFSVGC